MKGAEPLKWRGPGHLSLLPCPSACADYILLCIVYLQHIIYNISYYINLNSNGLCV